MHSLCQRKNESKWRCILVEKTIFIVKGSQVDGKLIIIIIIIIGSFYDYDLNQKRLRKQDESTVAGYGDGILEEKKHQSG